MHLWLAAIDHIVVNAAIFVGFFACATIHHWIVHKRSPTTAESVWHGFLAGVFSPATTDAVREFLVHLVVYSGYVIPSH